MEILNDPRKNKGNAFTIKERQLLGVHGLLAPSVLSLEQQVEVVLQNVALRAKELDKYIYLMELLDKNQVLFYRVLMQHAEQMLPLVYTPTVGTACLNFGILYNGKQGLYITIHDRGHVKDVLNNWPEVDIKAIVVTDGERILGLGDLGAHGMGIPIGKLCLYSACARIPPKQCLPITLDVGTKTENLLKDSFYIGLRQKRVTGADYDEFLDEFMQAVVEKYGIDTLIQFEDFGNHNAFHLLAKYRDNFCTFNDDIQGTAAIAVAGILAACRATGIGLKDHRILFQGAGEAALGIAILLMAAMREEGLSETEALDKIWLCDSKGLIVKDRPKGGLNPHKLQFAHEHQPVETLEEAVNILHPTAIIGVAAIPKMFTEKIIRKMTEYNKRPVIFALSNPTSKAECTAEEAYQYSNGQCIFASGSPFPVTELNGQQYFSSQCNNAYVFPGLALAIITCKIRPVTDSIFLHTAKVLANMATTSDISQGRILPPISQIQSVSITLAVEIAKFAFAHHLATLSPEPANIEEFIKSKLYQDNYGDNIFQRLYDWKN